MDFHSAPYYGEHPAVQRHYVSAHSRRQPSVLMDNCQDIPFVNCTSWIWARKNLPFLLTNDKAAAPKLITRYAQRMLIENALSDAVRFFHTDALSSAVGLKVDFDVALLVMASGLYRLLARGMRGYADSQARQVFRDLVDMPADVAIGPNEIAVRFHRRARLPIVKASGLLEKPVPVPWLGGLPLRLTT